MTRRHDIQSVRFPERRDRSHKVRFPEILPIARERDWTRPHSSALKLPQALAVAAGMIGLALALGGALAFFILP